MNTKMKFGYKTILVALVMTIPLGSCNTDELKELNINPQSFDQIDVNFLFTAAQLGSASGGSAGDNRFIDWRMNIGYCGHMMQQIANAGGGIAPGDKYFNGEDGAWEFLWSDVGKNIAEVIKQTDAKGFFEGKKLKLRNAARILRVFNFHRLTDYYGNIPYFDAFKGLEGALLPKYDAQQAIYNDMLKELSEATAALNASDPDEGFASADLFFAGDIVKWKRFGYSLMLRLAMRISHVDPTTASQYVNAAVAGGVMQSNADNVWVRMALGPSEWTNQNGISRAFASGDGGQPSYLAQTLVSQLKGGTLYGGESDADPANDDPRLAIFSGGREVYIPDGTNPDGTPKRKLGSYDRDPLDQVGLPNGLDGTTVKAYFGVAANKSIVIPEFASVINFDLLDDDDPYMIMHYAETEFLLAEAIVRGIGSGIPGTDQSHYEAGVKAAMQMYGPYFASNGSNAPNNSVWVRQPITVTDAQVTTYLGYYPYAAAGTEDEKLEMIGTQMWISQFFNWWEAWSNWRRTGKPSLIPVNYAGELGSNVTSGNIPTRMRIPSNEASANEANFLEGAVLPNELNTRVWWDVED